MSSFTSQQTPDQPRKHDTWSQNKIKFINYVK